MLTADTNVWARALLNDDQAQPEKHYRLSRRLAQRMEYSSRLSYLQNSRGYLEADGRKGKS